MSALSPPPAASCRGLLRLAVRCLLAAALVRLIVLAASKLNAGKVATTTTVETLDGDFPFPAVTVCAAPSTAEFDAFLSANEDSGDIFDAILTSLPRPTFLSLRQGDAEFLAEVDADNSTAVRRTVSSVDESLAVCYTFEPPLNGTISQENGISFSLDFSPSVENNGTSGFTTPTKFVSGFVHEPGALTATVNGMYGTAVFMLSPPPPDFDEVRQYEIGQVVHRALRTDAVPCVEDGESDDDVMSAFVRSNIEECFDDFVEGQVGCDFPWRKKEKTGEKEECSTHAQLERYLDVLARVRTGTEEKLAGWTGCAPRCAHRRFGLALKTQALQQQQQETEGGPPRPPRGLYNFWFGTTELEVREQVLLYDLASFVAEVGGYLGLLLGASTYSIYLMAEAAVSRCAKRATTATKGGSRD